MQNIDLKTFSPKDAKIIKENSEADAYGLLELGLSQKAFSRLLEGDYEKSEDAGKDEGSESVSGANTGESNNTENIKADSKIMIEGSVPGPLQPSSVESVSGANTGAPAKPKLSSAKLPSPQNGIVTVMNIHTKETFTMSLYFANMAIKDGKHTIVENGKG